LALIFVHVVLALFIIAIEAWSLLNGRRLCCLSGLRAMIALFYGFSPAVLHAARLSGHDHVWVTRMYHGDGTYWLMPIVVILLWLGIEIGWLIAAPNVRAVNIWKKDGGLRDSTGAQRRRRLPSLQTVWLVGVIMMVAGFGLYTLFSMAYGGYKGLIVFSAALRGGLLDTPNAYSYLQRFGGLCIFASYILFAVARQAPRRKGWYYFSFAVSVGFSLLVLMTWSGRLGFVSYVISFPLVVILGSLRPRMVPMILVVSAVFMVLIFASRDIFHTIRVVALGSGELEDVFEPQTDVMEFYLGEFSFPAVSALTTLDQSETGTFTYRRYKDFFVAWQHLVPARWISRPDKVSHLNRELIARGGIGEIPADAISVGLFSDGIRGVLVLSLLLGVVAGLVERFLVWFPIAYLRPILSIVLIFRLGFMVPYADPVNVLKGGFYLALGLAGFVAYWLLSRGMAVLRQLPSAPRSLR
jgi:hypothetical protein